MSSAFSRLLVVALPMVAMSGDCRQESQFTSKKNANGHYCKQFDGVDRIYCEQYHKDNACCLRDPDVCPHRQFNDVVCPAGTALDPSKFGKFIGKDSAGNPYDGVKQCCAPAPRLMSRCKTQPVLGIQITRHPEKIKPISQYFTASKPCIPGQNCSGYCYAMDKAKCGGFQAAFGLYCPPGRYFDDTKSARVISDDTAAESCCTEMTTCHEYNKEHLGYKKSVCIHSGQIHCRNGTTPCRGNFVSWQERSDSCLNLCYLKDTTKCLGASVTCSKGQYEDPAKAGLTVPADDPQGNLTCCSKVKKCAAFKLDAFYDYSIASGSQKPQAPVAGLIIGIVMVFVAGLWQ